MQRDDRDFLSHMLAAARDTVNFTSGQTYAEFMNDRESQSAVCKAMEMVGEAASRVSPDFRKAHPEIPWGEITGMRDHLVRAGLDVDFSLVWNTANSQLPELAVQLEPLIPPKTDSNPS